jgi:ubiquinol-cytochrome c reductase cytochrome b subunit
MDKVKPVPERVTMDGGMGFFKSVGVLAVIGVLTVLPLQVVGADSAYDCGTIPCDHIDTDPANKPSLQRGATLYTNYCMGCHSLQYSRYNRVARDLGIPEDLYRENLMFDPNLKIGALMDNAMDKGNAKKWFGATPPDLTLVSRSRQPDWLYTYLRTFYRDDSRPYGVNNKVFPEVGMPHVLMELQGLPECAAGPKPGAEHMDPLTGEAMMDAPCGRLEIAAAGIMSGEEYDSAIYDLVNFLAYTAEPIKLQRQEMGVRVMLFLAIFFVFAWLLSREYWKDVH